MNCELNETNRLKILFHLNRVEQLVQLNIKKDNGFYSFVR